ncbi:MAG: DUF669 domain-containing protein [Planctomycetes bacterium]|nr:DUF669 domain-containing protein [Planctomycetota bacterium]
MNDASTPFDPQAQSPYAAPPDLSAFDEEYNTVDPADNDEVPDGKYQVRVQRVKLERSQKGDPMLKWDLVVLSGPHANRHIFKNAVITQASLKFVKADLKTLGLELPRFSELPNHLQQLLDHALEVTKRTKDEYTNVYFNKRIQVPAGEPIPEGDIPF